MKKFNKYIVAGLIGLGVSISALALPPGGGDCGYAGPRQGQAEGRAWKGEGPYAEQRIARRKAWRQQRQAALHDKLNLNAEQEVAWKEFVASKSEARPKPRFNRSEMVNLTAPERMEKRLAMTKERQARLTIRMVEMKKFYAVLTSEQKNIFDETSRPHYRAGRHFGRR